jgi:glycosyltransferase involved in cell wall biosynthesis
MQKTPAVCLLYRKPGRFFSIERVFRQIIPFIGPEMSVIEWTAPFAKASPADIAGNIRAAGKCRADVYHVTGDIHYIVASLPRRLTMLTIHDCVFLYSATGIKRRILKWLLLDMPVRRCRLITTISEATKKDILRFTGCPPEKVVVIPDPVADTIRYIPAPFRSQEPVILFVGITDNKNLIRTAEALGGIPCRLHIVGKLSPPQEEALIRHGIRYTSCSGLSDEEMATQYADADLVLFPSTFEGFGLPIVEGQKAGRPVITSDISPMRETAGAGACLADPYDIAAIRQAVMRVIGDAAYREQLVQAGFLNITRFSPAAVAKEYISCYKRLLNQNECAE